MSGETDEREKDAALTGRADKTTRRIGSSHGRGMEDYIADAPGEDASARPWFFSKCPLPTYIPYFQAARGESGAHGARVRNRNQLSQPGHDRLRNVVVRKLKLLFKSHTDWAFEI